jgi:Raf kinase inhibitor-like YbhB/YbcL family protein
VARRRVFEGILTQRQSAAYNDLPLEAFMNATVARATVLVALLGGPAHAAMTLTSTDIVPGTAINSAHFYPRCGGRNLSPQLSWSGAPPATRSFVLTMVDLDVRPAQWSHWIVVDLPADARSLATDTPTLPGKARALVSNFGDAAYAGPCPPGGTGLHHYQFAVWAMASATVSFAADAKATDVIDYLSHHALDRAALTAYVLAPGGV